MKRPLYVAAVALMLGELIAEHMKYLPAVMAGFCILFVILYRYGKCKRKFITDVIVILIFFFLGAGCMNRLLDSYRIYERIKPEEEIMLCGEVTEVSQATQGYRLVVKVKNTDFPAGVFAEISFGQDLHLHIGNQIKIYGKKVEFEVAGNEGNFDEKSYYYGKKMPIKIAGKKIEVLDGSWDELEEKLAEIRQLLSRNLDSVCGREEAAVLKAVIYGDKSELDREQKTLYQRNGIAHILAISGLHMSLVGMGVYQLIRRKSTFLNAGVLSTLILIGFGCMIGFGVSVKRAMYMMIYRVTADVLGRTYDIRSAIGLSIILILLENPYGIYQQSFILSYSSMLAVGIVCPAVEKWMTEHWKTGEKRKKKKNIKWRCCQAVWTAIIIWLVNLPVTAGLFYEVPTYAVLLNLIVVPLLSVLFCSGMLASVLMLFCGTAAVFACGAGVLIVRLYTGLCKWVEKLPGAYWITGCPDKISFIVFYGILLFMLWVMAYGKIRKQNKWKLLMIACTGQILVIYGKIPDHAVSISTIDVGQGDCTLITSPEGHHYLVDGGSSSVSQPGSYRIVPYLKYMGVQCLDYVMISHGDSDHINGIEEILERDLIDIKNIALPDCGEYAEAYQALCKLAKKRGVSVCFIKKGDVIRDQDMSFTLLSPEEGTYEDINDASMVMLMEYGEFTMCFTGDISSKVEERLCISQKVDVLKVPHHGSKTSSSEEFLQKLQPVYGIISCGQDNCYGHPHQEVVDRYHDMGTHLFVTAECGRIRIRVPENEKGEQYEICSYLQ